MPTCEILLVTEAEVKSLTALSGNVDIKKFVFHIPIMQDLRIKQAIGSSCFDALLDAIENDDLTALETTLLEGNNRSFKGAKMALAWWVYHAALPNLHITTTASGLGKKIGQGFEGASVDEMNNLRSQAESYARYYTDQLIGYIKENSDDYPCYALASDTLSPISTDGYEGTSGIALDWEDITRPNPEHRTLNKE